MSKINKRLTALESKINIRLAGEEFNLSDYYDLLTSIMTPDEMAMIHEDLQNFDYIRATDTFRQVILDFPRGLTSQEIKKSGVDMSKFRRLVRRIEENQEKPDKVRARARKREEEVRHERNKQATCTT